MSKHVSISPIEAADRLAIRELVEAYAHCADRRDAKGQVSLFTADTHFVVFMNAKDPTPTQELPWTDDDPNAEPRPRYWGNLLHASSPHDQRWKPATDDCCSPLYRHLR